MAFIEAPRFPDSISYGSSGGPEYKTEVVTVASGYEYNNIQWDQAKHSYDAGMGVRTEAELSELISYFHLARGKAHRFRFKDWADYKTCDLDETLAATDQLIGIGDDTTTTFQLTKTYLLAGIVGGSTYIRTINKPVNGTVLIAIDGATQTETTHYSVNYTTGVVTFVTPPADTLEITWGGEFDVPVRFDTDKLNISLDSYKFGSSKVPIIEVKL